MPDVRLSLRAETDLKAIWDFIAGDNPTAADAVIRHIRDRVAMLADHPFLEPARPEIGTEVRFLVVGRYLVLYRLDGDTVVIVRVVHGARDVAALD